MTILNSLKGGLVVSCQPLTGGPMDQTDIIVAMARAAVDGGADGLRIEGVNNMRAVRAAVSVPLIGIVKRDLPDTPVRITPFVSDALELIEAGADIVAYDATDRPSRDTRSDIVRAIFEAGALAMGDCATLRDAKAAQDIGTAIIGTTLSGYTAETETEATDPDFALVTAFTKLGGFVMAEGRYNAPDLARRAIEAGANCVTVGSAITRIEHISQWFSDAVKRAAK
ncbi:putative N-acetylmannosamine-6-phosphate 2-epimerase [Aliiroseovarius sp. F47248L]|uniref:N-acetylmannosamine-6-phosphate 2-epimerase n=1 Tax=Aliiroseovarius sp. F47248L TaxID=2926420 RepID=UPI001FF637CB|nr:putative N-acetylmannosamine-6-phosphate 2-epimerase [Aliiroseovarius sp. F47248L]MCK0140669.1 putative N-acetylmannosamine-6-phosphate 2-epimerase [Aliiroseovarius sp. F47248L]